MRPRTFKLTLYCWSRERFQQVQTFFRALFDGLWLGWLDRESLHALDEHYYDHWESFRDQTYNHMGLFAWERRALEGYFKDCKRILVAGAGGGREVMALCEAGYEADGFECHPLLSATANEMLAAAGCRVKVVPAPRDQSPPMGSRDGLIVGWGTYMLIQGRQQRIEFLVSLRASVSPGAPLLVSFLHRQTRARRFPITAHVANFFRRLRRRHRVDVGDTLAPNFIHFFTSTELEEEMAAAGFRLVFFDTREYGHAVGLAH